MAVIAIEGFNGSFALALTNLIHAIRATDPMHPLYGWDTDADGQVTFDIGDGKCRLEFDEHGKAFRIALPLHRLSDSFVFEGKVLGGVFAIVQMFLADQVQSIRASPAEYLRQNTRR